MASPAFGGQWMPASDGDEIRTIFVTGFPPDTRERELQNLLRWWPGYEACQLSVKDKGEHPHLPLGFAIFSTSAMAYAARDALQGLIFDVDQNAVLRAEMAKSNLHRKKGALFGDGYDHSKRMRIEQTPFGAQAAAGFLSMPYDNYAMPAAAAGAAASAAYAPAAAPPRSYGGASHPNKVYKDNPPCNTLYIGNLGMRVNESELQALFTGQPGFSQMKVLRQGMSASCFVQFVDMDSAAAVHASLQGMALASSDRGPLRVQYSRTPLGQKSGRAGDRTAASAVAAAEAAGAGVSELAPGTDAAASAAAAAAEAAMAL